MVYEGQDWPASLVWFTEPLEALKARKEQLTVLVFWRMGCARSQELLRAIASLADARMRGAVVSIHVPELPFEQDVEEARAVLAQAGSMFAAHDAQGQLRASLGITQLPAVLVRERGTEWSSSDQEVVQTWMRQAQGRTVLPARIRTHWVERELGARGWPKRERGQLALGVLTNYAPNNTQRVSLEGFWRAWPDRLESFGGRIWLPYEAEDVYVTYAAPQGGRMRLGLAEGVFDQRLAGNDVTLQSGEAACVLKAGGCAHLVSHPQTQGGRLALEVPAGTQLYRYQCAVV